MPRKPRQLHGGRYYHVINRGSARQTVFHDTKDYQAFLDFMRAAQERVRMGILAVCLMPNHFHFLVRPAGDKDLSDWMHWVMTKQVARHRWVHQTSGHVWQGRFKPFEIRTDGYLLMIMRYVERNALRAALVERAEHWPWGSLAWRCRGGAPFELLDPPAGLPARWVERVNRPENALELKAVRNSVRTGAPLGVGTVPGTVPKT
ncbi:transposase [Thioalkalivibrio sp. XN8]|uniref:transposase n=1 Tax=Thioalkalivibrio sp. XN8 TaxID=2712863 RepID=UPI0013EDA619|nr:transposase [Thioalkalivibrio sp. XN8]NGP53762.1 transposase [Thioalkalivibrio sp. XN8]